jgi:hypothetical protein
MVGTVGVNAAEAEFDICSDSDDGLDVEVLTSVCTEAGGETGGAGNDDAGKGDSGDKG